MKYRMDFVTNSSSSSFICAFKNKADFESQMQMLSNRYSTYSGVIYSDILKNKITREEALKELKHYFYIMAEYELYWQPYPMNTKYWDDKLKEKGLHNWELMKLPEFKKEVDEWVKKEMSDIEGKMPKRGMYASVEYGDDVDFYAELEHEIMPYLPFVVYRINKH